jgi:hypothetical protein
VKRKIDLGHRAEQLLGDDTLMAAFNELEMQYTNNWKTSKVDESAKREQVYMSLRVLDDLKTKLQVFIDDGKIAKKQLQKMNT